MRFAKTSRVVLFIALFCCADVIASQLDVEIAPQFRGAPLLLDQAEFSIASGETISVTRLDFLVSDIALRREDGSWWEARDFAGYMSTAEKRNTLHIANASPEKFTAIRFHVGLAPELNHRDPAKVPAGEPLHPDVNGLHWGWQGGYIFLALEGCWSARGKPPEKSGYSFHIANDRELMTVEMPVALDLVRDRTLRLALDAERVFNTPNRLQIADATSTHSRDGDKIADQLRENIEHAFSFVEIAEPNHTSVATAIAPTLPLTATPYRLTFSRVFPIPDLPRDNPLTNEGVALGAKLFHDPRLSVNGAQSCASCHQDTHAFTDSPRRYSLGAEGAAGTRNAMPLFNLAWKTRFFWDGRAASLREQVRVPITDPREMHETLPAIVEKLSAAPEYPQLFENAFGPGKITAEKIALALEQFLLTRVSCDSKFDRSFRGEAQLSDEEKRGFQLFFTEYDSRTQQFGADCFHCHGGADFTNHRFANNGLDATPRDPGRYAITHDEADRGKFAVPSLRNVALTAPYMHDGRFATLEEVVAHYDHGVKQSSTLDPNLAKHPPDGLHLSEADQRALVAFLKTLTGASAGGTGSVPSRF